MTTRKPVGKKAQLPGNIKRKAAPLVISTDPTGKSFPVLKALLIRLLSADQTAVLFTSSLSAAVYSRLTGWLKAEKIKFREIVSGTSPNPNVVYFTGTGYRGFVSGNKIEVETVFPGKVKLETGKHEYQRLPRTAEYDLRERIKEQTCLYSITQLVSREPEVDTLLREAARLIPAGWQYPEITMAVITYQRQEYKSADHQKSRWSQSARMVMNDGDELHISIYYLEKKAAAAEGPFLSYERLLLNTISGILSMYIGQLKVKSQFQQHERMLKEAQHLASLGSWNYDVIQEKIYWSDSLYELFGVKPGKLSQQYGAFFDLVIPQDRDRVKKTMKEARLHGRSFRIEYGIRVSKGKLKYLEEYGYSEKNKQGQITRLYGTVQDITSRMHTEAALRESEQKYRNLFEASPLPSYIFDLTTLRLLDVNARMVAFYGYSREELLSMTIAELRPPEQVSHLLSVIKKFRNRKSVVQFGVFTHSTKAGVQMKMETTGQWLSYQGRDCMLVLATDVTDKLLKYEVEKLEREIIESTLNTTKSIQEILTAFILGMEQLFPEVKASMLQVRDGRLYNLVSPSLPQPYINALEGFEAGPAAGSCGTAVFTKKQVIVSDISTDPLWHQFRDIALEYGLCACWSYPIFGPEGNVTATFANYFATIRKPSATQLEFFIRAGTLISIILENYEKEYRLEISHERFGYVTRATSDAIWDWDVLNSKLFRGEGFEAITDVAEKNEEYNLENWFSLIHPEDILRVRQAIETVLNGEANRWVCEYRVIRKDKSCAYVADRAYIIRNEAGKPIRVIGAIRDITLKQQEEQRLRLLQSVVTNTSDAVLITDAEIQRPGGPTIVYANEAFLQMTGYTEEELVGKTPRLLQGPKSDFAELNRLTKSLLAGMPCEIITINYRKNREEYWADLTVKPVLDENGKVVNYFGIERDVTQQYNTAMQSKLLEKVRICCNQPEKLSTVLNRILKVLREFGNYTAAEIWMLSADRKKFNLLAHAAETAEAVVYYDENKSLNSLAPEAGLLREIWQRKQMVLWDHFDEHSNMTRREGVRKAGFKAALSLPLLYNEEIIGTLTIISGKHADELHVFKSLLHNLETDLGTELRRKQLEEELLLIFNTVPDILAVSGTDGYLKRINPAACNLLGYSEKELLSRPYLDLLHEEDRENVTQVFNSISEEYSNKYFEARFISKSGSPVWLAWTTVASPAEGYVFGVGKDITQQKELQKLLHDATSLARIGAWELDIATGQIVWSAITKEIHEVEPDYRPSLEEGIRFYTEAVRDKVTAVVKNAVEQGSNFDFEYPIITAKGNERWVRSICNPEMRNGTCVRLYGSFQDITKLKEAEIRLRDSANNIPGIIYQYFLYPDGHDEFRNVSDGARKILGMEPQDFMEDSSKVWKLIHADDLSRLRDSIIESARNLSKWEEQWRIYTREGALIWIEGYATPQLLPSGVVCWDMVLFDITEKKKLEELLNVATRLSRIGAWEFDMTSGTGKWSSMTRAIHEVKDDFVPTQESVLAFCREDERPRLTAVVEKLIYEGTPFDIELPVITATGRECWVRCIGESDRVNGKCTRMYGSFQDIHDRKLADLELVQRTKYLSAIASIAHVFLVKQDWFEAVRDTFDLARGTISTDRIFYSEIFKEEVTGRLIMRQRLGWFVDRLNPEVDLKPFQYLPIDVFPEVQEQLLSDQPYSAVINELPENAFKQLMKRLDVRSVLILPVMVEDKLSGIVGVEDCATGRKWAEGEVFFLRSISASLSAAIQRSKGQKVLNELLAERTEILESIGDGFFSVDKEWQVVYWNKQAEVITHIQRDKIIGQSLWEKFPPEQETPGNKALRLAMETGQNTTFEMLFAPLGIWVEGSVYPNTRGLSTYFKDITTRKKAEEELRLSNERFEIVSDATNDAIRDWDVIRDIMYWGKGYQKLFGYTETSFHPALDSWSKLLHPEDAERVNDLIYVTMADTGKMSWQAEYRYAKSDGSYAWVMDRGIILRDEYGRAYRLVGSVSDITYQKEYEKSLQRLNENLEKQTHELKVSNAELEQFAYVASHDLQEPLRMVTSFLTKLGEKYRGQLDERAGRYIDFAVDGAVRMRQNILDLLQYSRVGKGDSIPEDINLNEVVEEVRLLHQSDIDECGAVLEWDTLPVIHNYMAPVLQLFNNLISNAIKYRRPGIPPLVKILVRKVEGYWEFAIRDNGIGIEKEYLNRIFVIFQRLHPKERYSGTGIGLAVVKKIVENLEGRVWVESEPGKGSTFYFTLRDTNKLTGREQLSGTSVPE